MRSTHHGSSKMAVVRSRVTVTIPEDIKSFPRFMLKKLEEYGNDTAIVSIDLVEMFAMFVKFMPLRSLRIEQHGQLCTYLLQLQTRLCTFAFL